MKRLTTAASAIVLGSLACFSLAACQSGVTGQASIGQAASPSVVIVAGTGGSAASSVTTASAVSPASSGGGAASDEAEPLSAGSDTGSSDTGSSDTGSSDTGSSDTDSASTPTDTSSGTSTSSRTRTSDGSETSHTTDTSTSTTHPSDDRPRVLTASVSCTYSDDDQAYRETLTYTTANATQMALSVDNPGIVGAYATYGPTGTIEIPNLGCYRHNGEQRYDLYALNGPAPTGLEPSRTIKRTGEHLQPGVDETVTTAPTQAPAIRSASIACRLDDTDGKLHEFLSYDVRGATAMALSVDNPGLVGSFGTYTDTAATIEIPNLGCYSANGEQTYTLTTVGGDGPAASRTITRTGDDAPTVMG